MSLQSIHQYFGKSKRLVTYWDGAKAKTELKYDAMGRARHATPPGAGTENIEYDTANRKTLNSAESFGTNHYAYDPIKRTVTITNASGEIVHTHDALGRLVSTVFDFDSAVELSYDSDDPRVFGKSRLCAVREIAAGVEQYSIKFAYAPNGHKRSETLTERNM